MPDVNWDDTKNESNKKKHGLSFEQGARVFEDPNRIQKISLRDTERRYLTIGKAYKVFMSVVYTVRNLTFRIISVRRARKEERDVYLSNSLSKQDDNHE